MPLDLRRLRHPTGGVECAVHGHDCPLGGGHLNRDLYELCAELDRRHGDVPQTWEGYVAEERSRCRPGQQPTWPELDELVNEIERRASAQKE